MSMCEFLKKLVEVTHVKVSDRVRNAVCFMRVRKIRRWSKIWLDPSTAMMESSHLVECVIRSLHSLSLS